MAVISIRELMQCLTGASTATATLSVLNHFLGYTEVPRQSVARNEEIRIRTQAERLRFFPRFDINLIFVAPETLPLSVHRRHDENIAYARRLFASAGIAIGRIKRFKISLEDADGFEEIDSASEAGDLFACFSSPAEDEGIDVFVVRLFQRGDEFKGGHSPVDGSCNNDGKRSGLLVVFNGGSANFAHEIGHYLGLEHPDPEEASSATDPMLEGAIAFAGAEFSIEQGECMRDHCMMRLHCP